MSCGVGLSHGSDPMALLWLWHRLTSAAPIRPLAWQLPYAAGAALYIYIYTLLTVQGGGTLYAVATYIILTLKDCEIIICILIYRETIKKL